MKFTLLVQSGRRLRESLGKPILWAQWLLYQRIGVILKMRRPFAGSRAGFFTIDQDEIRPIHGVGVFPFLNVPDSFEKREDAAHGVDPI